MDNENIARLLPDAARQVTGESNAFRIAVVESGYEAGILFNLLTRAFQVPKTQIIELGMTVSDAQMTSLLSQRKPIIIIPLNILNHRMCRFHAPIGITQLTIFQAMGEELTVTRSTCTDKPFELQWKRSEPSLSADSSINKPNLDKKWWKFWE